ncbi:MAG: MATE family efflux transporter [Clostridia bacterium]|nr:MATE family efflux transporter [Clostridia bacterium]
MKKDLIKHKKTALLILSLAWPTIMEQIMQTAVQYIDTAMVGSLGTEATAAVGSTTTVGWLVFSSISALSVGFLSRIAISCGARNFNDAKKTASQAVFVTLLTGIISTVLLLSLSGVIPKLMQVDTSILPQASRYFFILYLPMLPRCASTVFSTVLRGAGDTKTPMKVGIAVNLINVLLNLLLIYPSRNIDILGMQIFMPGADLGVDGAAIASATAFTVGGIMITVALFKHPQLKPTLADMRPDKSILAPCFRVAIPNMLQRFCTSLGYVVFASMINSVGDVATATHTIANTVESAFYIPGFGMQTAAATLIGNAYGARDEGQMKKVSAMFIPIELILMTLSGLALFFLAPTLMGLFSSNADVISLGTTVLRMVSVTEPFYGIAIILEGMLLGIGQTKTPFIYNLIGMWGVRIVGTFICTQLVGLGLIAAWGCMIAHNLLLCLMFYVNYKKGKWYTV